MTVNWNSGFGHLSHPGVSDLQTGSCWKLQQVQARLYLPPSEMLVVQTFLKRTIFMRFSKLVLLVPDVHRPEQKKSFHGFNFFFQDLK